MTYLHLMRDEKPLKGIVRFYNKFFNDGNHCICYINTIGKESLINKDVTISQEEVFFNGNYDFIGTKELIKIMKKFDRIVIHSMFCNPLVSVVLSKKKTRKKIIWIEWGYDLYNWKSKGKLSFISNRIHYKLRTNCYGFVGIFPPDCDYYRNQFPKSKAKVFYAPYCNDSIPEFFMNYTSVSRLKETLDSNDTIYILLGHSATKEINHIDAIKKLKRFSKENIRIVIPLSYGDSDYADIVQATAEESFGLKAMILREFMPLNEYNSIIDRIDIAVFNTNRQIGLGNIYRLIFHNTKIYMPSESPMYTYFRENGINIQDYDQLDSTDYESLIHVLHPLDNQRFEVFRSQYTDMNYKIALWKTVYK